MPPPDDASSRLSPEMWRRIGAVLDRIGGPDATVPDAALAAACAAEGLSTDDVTPFLDSERRASTRSERIDSGVLAEALQAFTEAAEGPRLDAGHRLGPYEIVAAIGSGGMGRVYEARDTRLGRSVAIKLLHADLASRPESRQRFEREARAISNLNHPHICTLHDVGADAGVDFLVMELVEGQTLADRLARGPLPWREAAGYAAQIADALAAAHARGIVHRDLKPSNVMLTPHGVKVLDFGLAALRQHGDEGVLPDSTLTAEGTLLGTLRYMSPEQLQGKPVDGRADVFALGAILYEMVTRQTPFDADSAASVIAAVLEREPPPASGRCATAPAMLDWTIARCLAKAPGDRWQHAADLASQLRYLTGAAATIPTIRPRMPAARRAWMALAASALVLSAAAFGYRFGVRHMTSPASFRFEILPPAGTRYERLFALSPDGRHLAFTAGSALWIRPLDGGTPMQIPGTAGGLYPFWSPDGRAIGFFADRKLKVTDPLGKSIRVLCDTGIGGGATWSASGMILFADESTIPANASRLPLKQIPASGGAVTPATTFEPESEPPALHAYPHFLPDGRHFLYMQIGLGTPGVYLGSLDGGRPTRIVPAQITRSPERIDIRGALRAAFANGYLFYVRETRLMARRFDVDRGEVVGDEVVIATGVFASAPGRDAFDVSPSGLLVYLPNTAVDGERAQLAWFDRTGRELERIGEPGPYGHAVVSRDGSALLVSPRDDRSRMLIRIALGNRTTTPLVSGRLAIWSPDASRIAYIGGQRGPIPQVMAADGSGRSEMLIKGDFQGWPGDWSADGRMIVGTVFREGTGQDIFATVVGSHEATYPIASRFDESDPRLSPDGRWLAYAASDENRQWHVYVRAFDGTGRGERISRDGGRYPIWGRNGREIFYAGTDGTLVAATVEVATTFKLAGTTPLFQRPALVPSPNAAAPPTFGVAPDGRRFVISTMLAPSDPRPLVAITDWPSLVRR